MRWTSAALIVILAVVCGEPRAVASGVGAVGKAVGGLWGTASPVSDGRLELAARHADLWWVLPRAATQSKERRLVLHSSDKRDVAGRRKTCRRSTLEGCNLACSLGSSAGASEKTHTACLTSPTGATCRQRGCLSQRGAQAGAQGIW